MDQGRVWPVYPKPVCPPNHTRDVLPYPTLQSQDGVQIIQVKSSQDKSSQVKSRQVKSSQVKSSQVKTS